MDDFRPEAGQGLLTTLRSQGGQATMPVKLERILADGGCTTLEEHVRELRARGDLPVRNLAKVGS